MGKDFAVADNGAESSIGGGGIKSCKVHESLVQEREGCLTFNGVVDEVGKHTLAFIFIKGSNETIQCIAIILSPVCIRLVACYKGFADRCESSHINLAILSDKIDGQVVLVIKLGDTLCIGFPS